MKKTTDIITKLAFAAILLTSSGHAEYVTDADLVTSGNQPGSLYKPLTLTGTTKSEGWQKLTSALYPGNGSYPGTASWTGALASQVGANAGASGLAKISNGTGGGPYPSSASIYFGGYSSIANNYGGSLAVQASGTAVQSGVKTVIFHVDIGEAWTYDLYNDDAPVLNVTTASGTTQINAVHASKYAKVYNGQVLMDGNMEDLYINSRIYQFDLSLVSGTITSISVGFDGVEHCQLYGLGLQQSTTTYTSNILPAEAP